MDQHTLFILIVISMAFFFEFINGFHDASNSIATIVTTGVLTPRQAVLWAAFFNFIAFLFFSLMVAKTIGDGLIDTTLVNAEFILSALIGAVFWNLLTWYYGLPSSSTHALVGGLIGGALAKGGFTTLKGAGLLKVAAGIFISPILGMLAGYLLTLGFTYLLKHRTEQQFEKSFKGLQLISSALLSLTHGGNDAQKTMGIIAVLLFSEGWLSGAFYVPFWIVISCQAVISLGTLAGGWRIVHTMGTKITHLNPMKGCAAEAGAAATIFLATELGIPVSTTHTVTGSITGSGLVSGLAGAHWNILSKIFLAWLFTIPAAASISAAMILIFEWFN